jgi:hypothetical protein
MKTAGLFSVEYLVIVITASTIITATTVGVSLPSASSNISSLLIDGLVSNACCWNGLRCAVCVARWVSSSSGSWAFSSSAFWLARPITSSTSTIRCGSTCPAGPQRVVVFQKARLSYRCHQAVYLPLQPDESCGIERPYTDITTRAAPSAGIPPENSSGCRISAIISRPCTKRGPERLV